MNRGDEGDGDCPSLSSSREGFEIHPMIQIRKITIRNLDPGFFRFSSFFPQFSLVLLTTTLRNPDPELHLEFSCHMHRVHTLVFE